MSEQEKRDLASKAFYDAKAALHKIGGTDPDGDRMASADLTLALRHLEDALFRTVHHIQTEVDKG